MLLKHKQHSHGFTLLEIVVAVSIFAVIATIAFPSLIQFLDIRERINEKQTEITLLQKTFLYLANDLRFAVNRYGKNEFGDRAKTTILINDKNLLELVTLSQDINLLGQSVPRKVIWQFDDGTLLREQYPVADPDSDTRSYKLDLITDIASIDLEVNYVEDGKDQTASKWDKEEGFPALITFDIEFNDGRTYQRVFALGAGGVSVSD